MEAVIFDFGGVILDIDYDLTDRAMRALLGVGSGVEYTKARQSEVFDQLEEGKITALAFRQAMSEASGRSLSDDEINRAWNAMLIDVPPKRFALLRKVAERYPIYLYSNTNEIHKAAFDLILERHLGAGGFDKLFRKAYYSHTFGLRKPHRESYEALLRDAGLRAESTLFIDDSMQNIVGAREAGLQTHHLTGDILQDEALLTRLGIKKEEL